MSYGEKTKTLDLVKHTVGVINGIFLVYNIFNFHDVFSRSWCPVHWFDENICLVYWLQTSLLQYFVLYETPPSSKLPLQLKGSIELVVRMETQERKLVSFESKHDGTVVVESENEETPFAFPGMKETFRCLVGVFQGTGRRVKYHPFHLSVTEDFLFPYKQISYILQDHSNGEQEERNGRASFLIHLIACSYYHCGKCCGARNTSTRSFYLQASEPNTSDQVFQKNVSRERRRNRCLWRIFRRQLYKRHFKIEEAVVILIAHRAAMHFGFSLSSNTRKQRHI
ncbi:hypothetical protein GAYE_SCF17G3774 [Galdieria yellowstonensis]|uniref:Uncharacterized protein n=1 Tax=Galdieria yellowstonensis TaxID=3028027 RepID=A0AAV9IEI5_9RHOD|nr:hypothetical protein GAYE_SCF17G3774 [Galdieria yellowstonensis]